MLGDSVREELAPKLSNASRQLNFELTENKTMSTKSIEAAPIQAPQPKLAAAAKPITKEISIKTTNPTLIEFHNKNTVLPEWRLQLQNVVRQRQDRGAIETRIEMSPTAQIITSGANALKSETIPQPRAVQHKNPTLSNALKRIEESRQQFLAAEKPAAAPAGAAAAPIKANKNYPFHIAGKNIEAASKPAEVNPPVNSFRPKLAPPPKDEPKKLDTNKLPPLSKLMPITESFESRPVVADDSPKPSAEAVQPKIAIVEKIEVKDDLLLETAEASEIETVEECDDYAPFAMRFNAGLFDLIIGSFVSLLLLAPFMLFGGNWISIAGAFAFIATCAIVMFIYLTTAVGFYGKTFGMRLFSLEIIDIENEDYPTFHQAAVSSAVYLLSLAFGGIGFLTLPFNPDRRAVHDIVSGTVIVREE